MDWVLSHLDDIGSLTAAHAAQCVPAIVLGFVISVPLGYLGSRSRAARSVLLTGGNVLYTIPGLALVILVPITLGLPLLDSRNVVFALIIYAIALMVRSATDAFSSVSPEVRQSATAQGYSAAQRFWRVELPLAGPVLLAGVRVVSVSTISLATIGALIGIQNLGTFFTDAQARAFPLEAAVGIVLVLLLAAVFDILLTVAGRLLMPWTAAAGSRRRRRAARRVAVQGRAA